jgi:hypothetical protein
VSNDANMNMRRVATSTLSLVLLASGLPLSIGLATPAQAATTSYTFEQLVDTVPVTPPLYVG